MRRQRSFLVALISLLALAAMPLTAVADAGDDDDDGGGTVGKRVDETITIEGETIDGSEARTVSVPVECWWSPIPDEMFEVWQELGDFPFVGTLLRPFLPSDDYVEEKLEVAKDTPGSWYTAFCTEDADDSDKQMFFEACGNMDECLMLLFSWFADSEDGQPAVIQPEDLANAAFAELEIPEPEIDQNPKMEGTERTTFVGMPTAFWVTDPDAVGGADGELTLRASVPETGLWVEVSAQTDGLSITSDAGSTTCDPASAASPWTPDSGEPACAVEFERASTMHPAAGYPVDVTAVWEASWEGGFSNGETDGGDLETLSTESTVLIPVAEVQSIVGGD